MDTNGNENDIFENNNFENDNFENDKFENDNFENDNHNYDSIAPQKGIFEPTFLPLSLDFKQRELAKKMKIKIENLNKRQISDLYYWTKYVLNNQLDYLFKSEDIYKKEALATGATAITSATASALEETTMSEEEKTEVVEENH